MINSLLNIIAATAIAKANNDAEKYTDTDITVSVKLTDNEMLVLRECNIPNDLNFENISLYWGHNIVIFKGNYDLFSTVKSFKEHLNEAFVSYNINPFGLNYYDEYGDDEHEGDIATLVNNRIVEKDILKYCLDEILINRNDYFFNAVDNTIEFYIEENGCKKFAFSDYDDNILFSLLIDTRETRKAYQDHLLAVLPKNADDSPDTDNFKHIA